MLTFSFGRASLGMALYFYGLSYLLKPNENHKTGSYLWGVLFIVVSYFGHRSMLPLIVMTPLAFMRITKQRVILLVCMLPVLIIAARMTMQYFVDSDVGADGQLEGFAKAVRSYATVKDFELNWKFRLITTLRNASHYILCIYLLWVVWLKRHDEEVPRHIKGFVTITVLVACVATSVSLAGVGIASVVSKRYLYMTGIPLCIALAYTVQKGLCGWHRLNLLLLVSLVWSEGYFIGKLASYYYA
jgi:hypothetical protein